MSFTHKIELRKWIRRVLIGLPILVMVLGTLTWLAGTSAKARLKRAFPAPGQLVDVGGYRLHVHCIGHGSPTVLLESGNNDFSLQWSSVQPELGKSTRVCAYDRAGLGWSDAGPGPRSIETTIRELHTLLTNSEIKGPYVLVGHSLGGIIARAYARQYPSDLKGMLLVDSAHEQQAIRVPGFAKAVRQTVGQFRILSAMTSLGLLALSSEQIPDRGLSGSTLEQYRAVLATTDYFHAASIETETLLISTGDSRNGGIASLGELPLIVLTRGLPEPLPGLSDAENRQYEQTWQSMQRELVGLSSHSRQIIAEHSGHYIQLQQPDLVIGAISELLGGERDLHR